MDEEIKIKDQILDLTNRVSAIEEYIAKHEYKFKTKSELEKQINNAEISPSEKTEEFVPLEPSSLEKFFEWLKTDWLMKLGAFLLLLALGWFVNFAFVNNWIGPMGRVSLGIIVGAGVMISGNFLMPKKRAVGQVIVVLGGIMILLTIFSARMIYDFFTPATALAMMSVVVTGMAVVAVFHKAKSVAILAFIGGAAVPVLVDSPQPDHLSLLYYIFVLNIGTIFVASFRGWREIISLAIIVTGIYSIVAFFGLERGDNSTMIWVFMALFFVLFFVSNIVAIIKTRDVKRNDLLTTAINALLLLYWIYEFVPKESASLLLSAVVVLLIGVSYVFRRLGGLKSTFYLNSALAILFLGSATAFELNGEALTIAFSIEALIIVILSIYALKDLRLANLSSALLVIPTIMAFPSIENRSWTTGPLFNEDFFVLFALIISLALTAIILKIKDNKENKISLANYHGIAAGIFSLVLVWLSSHNIFDSVNMARGVSLVLYSIVGVILLFYGSYLHKNTMRIVGTTLLAGVVVWLLVVEVWSMSLAGKIITFVAIGILLVSTAFFKNRINKTN